MEEKAGLAGLSLVEVSQAVDKLRGIGQGEIPTIIVVSVMKLCWL